MMFENWIYIYSSFMRKRILDFKSSASFFSYYLNYKNGAKKKKNSGLFSMLYSCGVINIMSYQWRAGNAVCVDFLDESGLKRRKFFDDNYNFRLYWTSMQKKKILDNSPFQYYIAKELRVL